MLSATKFIAIAAVLAGLTSAQTESDLPACAQTCITKFTTGTSIGGCASLDAKCICSSNTFISSIACCLAGVCDAADQEAATQFALQFCQSVGVTGLPTAVSCTSSIASSTSSTPSSSSASGAGTSSTSSTSSAGSSASSASSSVSSAASVSSGSSTASSASAAATTKGAASHNQAGMGAGVLGGLAAVAVLL